MTIDDTIPVKEVTKKIKDSSKAALLNNENYRCYSSSDMCNVYLNKALTIKNGLVYPADTKDDNTTKSFNHFYDMMMKKDEISAANA